jgi:acyl-[acyl-carrier-protein]-phospholipid O-acyltransferase/long-chain-fatty-acid--[acyl-carrier-protein] ligase
VTFAVGQFEISARQTFFGLALILGGGFWWALMLVPDAFLRFLLLIFANTFYRVQVRGRENVPLEGGAAGALNKSMFAILARLVADTALIAIMLFGGAGDTPVVFVRP